MAWNGRNESILGAKGETKDAPTAVPSKEVKGTSKAAPNNQATDDAAVVAKKPLAPAPPVRSVWNGRHKKITGIREESQAGEAAHARSSPSPAISASGASKKETLVVISPPKDDAPRSARQLQAADEKEDETTNSTAGSSVTKSIDEDPRALDVTTQVVTPVSSTGSEKTKKDAGNDASSAAIPTTKTSNGSDSNRQNNSHAKNKSKGANANAPYIPRRSGSYKGPPPKNGNNHTGSSNISGRQNYSRGGSSGSGRRRSYNVDKAAFPYSKNLNKNATAYVPNKRRAFDPHKALAIRLAKGAQDCEDRSLFASTAKIIHDEKRSEGARAADPPFFSIDVECIATGYGSCAKGINDGCGNEGRLTEGIPSDQYNDSSHRYPGRVAMVDSDGGVLADIIVRPPRDGAGVTSYLTPLTGLTAELCLGPDAKPLDEAVAIIKDLLTTNGVLVGHAIDHDVEWLGLTPGKDFARMVDVSQIFRQRLPFHLYNASIVLKQKEEGGDGLPSSPVSDDPSSDDHLGFATRYRHFSLRHVCKNLLDTDMQAGVHDPVIDARYALMLFHKYRNSGVTQLRILRDALHRAPITPSFSVEHTPVIEGVCVSTAAYHYRRAARKIWWWYSLKKKEQAS